MNVRPGCGFERRLALCDLVGAQGVDLAEGDNLGFFAEPFSISGEFAPHGSVGGGDIAVGSVDEMQQRRAAFNVTEKAVADAGAFMGALDQAGNVCENEALPLANAHHAKVGMKRRERIIGDLRFRRRHRRQKRRLAGVRQADKADIGDQFETQPDRPHFAGLAGIGPARRAVGG